MTARIPGPEQAFDRAPVQERELSQVHNDRLARNQSIFVELVLEVLNG